MIKILENLNESKDEKEKLKVITIVANDYYGEIEKLLNAIKDIASIGHTFKVVVDPNTKEYTQEIEIDGDGPVRIEDIKISFKNKDEKEINNDDINDDIEINQEAENENEIID